MGGAHSAVRLGLKTSAKPGKVHSFGDFHFAVSEIHQQECGGVPE